MLIPLRHCLVVALCLGAAWTPVSARAQAPEGVLEDLQQGRVDLYVAHALNRSPAVQAAYHRWQAARHRVARAHTLPEPTLSFEAFVRSVETRVGPQQARLRLAQRFPWPTALTAAHKAAEAEAKAAEARLEATALAVAEQVEVAFWDLWEVRQTRALHESHVEILQGLSEALRTRMAVGAASLTDVQQADLSRARLEDGLVSMAARESDAQAALAMALGLQGAVALPTTQAPALALPEQAYAVQEALNNPLLASLALSAEASEARARAAGAARLPSFEVGGNWVITGPSVVPGVLDSGKDAVSLGLGVSLPLWQGTYGHDIAAERATAEAQRAQQQAAGDALMLAMHHAISDLTDSARRAKVLTDNLLPQAQALSLSRTFEVAVLSGGLAESLLVQAELLALRVELVAAQADHQRAWARVERLNGSELERVSVTPAKEQP